ncbi:hypothetical protein [Enterococcus faecium]|uniref:hypothetical protein n=1 Tax=Enterococcus faecium TaxID=1352 RepID=UPI0019668ED8|nr:hypothetical protein [Enterococcus faecium]
MAKDYGAFVSTPDAPSACCGASGQIHHAIQKSKYVSGYACCFGKYLIIYVATRRPLQ